MPIKSAFFDKLVERIDRLDPQSIQTHFMRLARERGLLETIFHSIQEGVVAIDGKGRLTYANRAAESMLGFSFEQYEGRPVSRYLGGVEWQGLQDFDESEWSKLITQEIEITYPEHRFVSFYLVPLTLEESEEQGAVMILRDVTHERAQEANLLETERLNAVKLLAAGVAHEIGNPLNALNIHLQLLNRELQELPEPQVKSLQELVEVARTEVSRLDLIITQFLRAIRPSKPELVPSQIKDLLEETLVLLKQEIQQRNIEVEIHCPKPLPKIHVDRSQMKQVFFNMTKNAFQAMPDNGSLIISLSTTDRFAAIVFRDSGEGIKAEDLGRIFEPYHTTKPDGTGLGLMIVQRIVQEHGGHIEVSSKPGEGTRFAILLPLAERQVRLLKAPRRGASKDAESKTG